MEGKNKNSSEVEKKVQTANEFTNVKDIKNSISYGKDDYIFAYLRIFPYNIDLLSEEDKRLKIKQLSAQFKGNDIKFAFLSLPREVDIDKYKSFLERKHQEEIGNQNKKRVLSQMIRKSIELSTFSENFEHQLFLKCWKKNIQGSRKEYIVEKELKETILQYQQNFASVKIKTEVLDERKILELHNLFANGIKAAESNSFDSIYYTPHSTMY